MKLTSITILDADGYVIDTTTSFLKRSQQNKQLAQLLNEADSNSFKEFAGVHYFFRKNQQKRYVIAITFETDEDKLALHPKISNLFYYLMSANPPSLKSIMDNPEDFYQSKIQKVQTQIEEVIDIAKMDVLKLLDREEALEKLEAQSENLLKDSERFQEASEKLNVGCFSFLSSWFYSGTSWMIDNRFFSVKKTNREIKTPLHAKQNSR